MSEKSLPSVGYIIDETWRHYRANFGEYMSASSAFLVNMVLNIVGLSLFPSALKLSGGQALTTSENIGNAILLLNNLLITPAITVFVIAALIRLINIHANNRASTLRAVFTGARKDFWPLVFVSIIFSLILLGTLLALVPGGFLLLIGDKIPVVGASVVMIGTLFMIIGVFASGIFGLLWGTRFYFFPYELVVEGHRGIEAFRASHALVFGRFWATLLRLIIPKLLIFLLLAIVLFVARGLADILIAGTTGLNIELQTRITTIVVSILATIQLVLANPLLTLADYLVYRGLKES